VKGRGGFVVETIVTNDAPKGDGFFVLLQWVGISTGLGSSMFRVSYKVSDDRMEVGWGMEVG
jgi:hypothetical protein